MESFAGWPINMAFISRASSSAPPLEASLEWGASGFKIHEDLGAYPAVIDQTLRVADAHDVQVMIHTDSINESVSPRGHDRGDRRAHDPRLPRRGRGRRPRARPAGDRRRAERAAFLDEPDQPVLGVGREGAPRHDHVGAPDEPGDPRGRGVRAVARAPRDDGRRGRAPRSRRDLDDRRRLDGHGPRRRRPCAAASSSRT